MKSSIGMVDEILVTLEERLVNYGNQAMDELEKIEQSMAQHEEALLPPGSQELSVMGQLMVAKVTDKATKFTSTLTDEHKQMHHRVSKVGKVVDREFCSDVGGLVRNEKDIETDAKSQRLVDNLICDYLLSSGYPDVADALVKEANIGDRMILPDEQRDSIEKIMTVRIALENQDVRPAVEWLEECAPDESRLRFDLLKQHAVELGRTGKTIEAIEFVRTIAHLGFNNEIAILMGALVRGPNDPRYESIFSSCVWSALLARISQVMSQTESHLEEIIDTGKRATLALMRIKNKMGGRKDYIFCSEELPCAVPVAKVVHNTFTCPILRQQTTDANPPMKLHCGHVISQEAIKKLSNANRIRMKCPYCPDEAPWQDAKQVRF